MRTWLEPFVFVSLVWWLSTGLILLLDRRAVSVRISLFFSGLLAAGSLICLSHINRIETPAAAYGGFICAILIWVWVEVSFLTGTITGPRREAMPQGSLGAQRLRFALSAVLYHELLIIAAGALIAWVSWKQPNQVAWWTWLALWIMRSSAKLNLFLGVRNFGLEFLPTRMTYLGSFFRRRNMNWLFPISIVGITVAVLYLINQALQANTGRAASTGLFLVVALLILAMLEHWLMVLPIQASRLWKWAMPERTQHDSTHDR